MNDVTAIGSITRDNFLVLDYEVIKWPKAPLGKAILFPLGEKIEVQEVVSTIGGNSANASATFSRQGFRAACFGKVGNDLLGKEIQARLKKEKVTPLLAISKTLPTASSVLLLKNGERTILGYHGASNTLGTKDIPWSKLKSRWWYLSLAGGSDVLLRPLLVFAKKNNIQVAFNPSGYHLTHHREEIIASLSSLTFLVLNAGEAAQLTGIDFHNEQSVFQKLDAMTPGIVAVTDGPKGVTVSDGKNIYQAGVFQEKKLVDRTGAGDAFGSGFVAGLMLRQKQSRRKEFTSEDIQYAIRLATANATAVVEQIGATEGVLTKAQFLKSPQFQSLSIDIRPL